MRVQISSDPSGPHVNLPKGTVSVVRGSYPVDGEHEKRRCLMVALDADGQHLAGWEERFVSLTRPPSAWDIDPETALGRMTWSRRYVVQEDGRLLPAA